MRIRREKTALRRTELSRPLRLAINGGLLPEGTEVFDYGCGHGSDVRHLRTLGFEARGWDPAHAPDSPRVPADVVNLGFVVNVIENRDERIGALMGAWRLAKRLLIVSARLQSSVDEVRGEEHLDGIVTRLGTFQRYFTQPELQTWIENTLEESPVPAAPGVFLIFRDAGEREAFVASRFRRSISGPRIPVSAALYAEHRELLEPLVSFFVERGRVPYEGEFRPPAELVRVFGSVRSAFAVVRRATGARQWAEIENQRREDLLLYLAHSQFSRSPRFTDLPAAMQADIRAFHGNYTKSVRAAIDVVREVGDQDAIDAACRKAPVGKVTPQALYVHRAYLTRLPILLRLYEACARGLVGEVEDANIVKLHRYRPQVSYLCYPDFERNPHPPLTSSAIVWLDEARTSIKDHTRTPNPPILHRKEELVSDDHPSRAKFAKLTKQEENAGLYRRTSVIGNLRGWLLALDCAGVTIRGHRLMRRRT